MIGPAVRPAPGRPSAAPRDRPLNPILRWMFYLLIFSIPFEFPGRSFPLEIPTITAALFLLATLLKPSACYARRPVALVWFAAYLYMFWLAAALNARDALATYLVTPNYWPQVRKLFLVEFEAVLVFWAAFNLLRSPQLARALPAILAVACAICALLPVFGIASTTHEQGAGGARITALGQDANNSAMILSAGLVALVGLRYGPERGPAWRRWLTWPLVALLVVAVVDTGSRGGLVALGMGLAAFALSGARTIWTSIRNVFVTALALGFIVAVAYNSATVRTRFEAAVEGELAGRERLYPALVQMVKDRPIIGWGPINNKYELGIRLDERRRRDAHNVILEVLTATGVLGAIPFIAGVGLCVVAAWRARHRAQGAIPIALAVEVLVANMSGDWIAGKLLWLTLAYGLASLAYAPLHPPTAAPPGGPARRLRPGGAGLGNSRDSQSGIRPARTAAAHFETLP